MAREEFPKKVKLEAWVRCKERCENCGQKIRPGNGPVYDHIIPTYVGGPPTLENCKVLCERPCNRAKTDQNDRPEIDKTRAVLEKRAKARDKGRGWRRPDGVKFDWKQGRYRKDETDC